MVLIRTPPAIHPSEITPEAVYRERRRFMQAGLVLSGAALLGTEDGYSYVIMPLARD